MPKYTIAMCNYNMEGTLEQSLRSILDQLNDEFEVLVVDDGSTDSSTDILNKISREYATFRYLSLPRDKKRKLGETRNISVREANGEYVLLHLDCDDTFGPFIQDFVFAYHKIEECRSGDFLLSGQHINMARKEFLLSKGPYRNLQRCQDRDLWIRLAGDNAYLVLDHVDFATRLPKFASERMYRIFVITWEHMLYDFRTGMSIASFLQSEANRKHKYSVALRALRLAYVIPAKIISAFYSKLEYPNSVNTPNKLIEYRAANTGTLQQHVGKHGLTVDVSTLSNEAKEVFRIATTPIDRHRIEK